MISIVGIILVKLEVKISTVPRPRGRSCLIKYMKEALNVSGIIIIVTLDLRLT